MSRFLTSLFVIIAFAGSCVSATASAAKLDSSFGDEGTVITKSGSPVTGSDLTDVWTGNAWALIEDREGRLLAGGTATNRLFVARYLEDGSLDTTFGDGGRVFVTNLLGFPATDFISPIRTITVLPDGKILLAAKMQGIYGQHLRGGYSQYVRLLPDGSVDEKFGSRPGFLGSPMATPLDSVGRPDGGYYLVGTGESSTANGAISKRHGFVSSYGPDGRLDKSFGQKGEGIVKVQAKKWPFYNAFNEIKRLKSGKLLVGGYDRNRFVVGRLSKNGRWDKSFGQRRSGRTVFNPKMAGKKPCFCVTSYGLGTDRRGRIYQSAYSYPGGKTSDQRFVNVIRYLPNGRLDRSYGKNGRTVIDVKQTVLARRLAVLPSGKVFVTANLGPVYATKMAVFAFRSNGKPDRSFFNNGRYTAKIGSATTAENALIDSKGRLVVAGGTNLDDDGSFVIKRFNVR